MRLINKIRDLIWSIPDEAIVEVGAWSLIAATAYVGYIFYQLIKSQWIF